MIEVTHDGTAKWMPKEPCAICAQGTRYWYTPKGVAVCQRCAETATPDDIPSKHDWLRAQGLELTEEPL